MTKPYNPSEIEPKWQAKWEADKIYEANIDPNRPKHYALTMFPYPSGNLHIGHWYAMTPSDARARFMRMKGYNVLFPMGFDSFGLPAENAAIKRNIHPREWTYANIDNMRRQLRRMGAIFDWRREVVTCDPEYYKWNQWFFIQFYKHGLAYRKKAPVDWCPTCNTTLAREQVVGEERVCERCGTPVIKKNLEQWFFRITDYAEELKRFDGLDWPERIKTAQRNWIGDRSEGANVFFKTEQGHTLEIFTTRPDTLWGVTFMVLAPEHPVIDEITPPEYRPAVDRYRFQAARFSDTERQAAEREKTGVFTGAYAINPVNGEKVPIWIADYVLMSYGSGAIMAVPAHDQRDYEFAKKYGLEIRPVIFPLDENGSPIPLDAATMEEAYPGPGVMANSGPLTGTRIVKAKGWDDPGIMKVIEWLEEKGIGERAVNYRLRDWLISRQRYWGTPIPMVYCEKCGWNPVPEDQLPVELPDDVEWKPTGESPLKFHPTWKHTTCPVCGGPAIRETDTMDTFMDSSWYHLAYLSLHGHEEAPFEQEEYEYWFPVDTYTGGAEHATMHLLYVRFFHKALRDLGIVDGDEPMIQLRNQGIVLGEPRDGHFITVTGHWEGNAFHAERIVALPWGTPRSEWPDFFQGETEVRGEVYARDETTVKVRVNPYIEGEDPIKTARLVIIHVGENTTVEIPGKPGARHLDLVYHLEAEKMSKSKFNVVDPDDLVDQYGADTVRAYLMFFARWDLGGPWNSKGIGGVVRWLRRVWNLVNETANATPPAKTDAKAVRSLRRKVHQTLKNVTRDFENFEFNTIVAALMELLNEMQRLRDKTAGTEAWQEAIDIYLRMMAPITPFIAEELWVEVLGKPYSIHNQSWPEVDEEAIKEETITLVVQVNGKVRDRLQVPVGIAEEEAKAMALASEAVQRHLKGKEPRKVIYVPGRLVNIVA